MMVIYKVTNLINGKIYVGKNKVNDPNYFGSGVLIKDAIKIHGKENFTKEILESCQTEAELNDREKYWIEQLRANVRGVGYNITDGGDGGDTFTTRPEAEQNITRLKISKISHNITEETRNKHRQNTKNLWENRKYRKKVCEAIQRTVSTPEHKANFSKKMKEVCNRPSEKLRRSEKAKGSNNSKWLGFADLYDPNNNFVKRYECLSYLRQEVEISSRNLIAIMNGANEIIIGYAKRKKLKYENYSIKLTKV